MILIRILKLRFRCNVMQTPYPITLIVAIAENGVIGKDNAMPWHIPSDLQQFKARTKNRVMIMGRKTFDSLPGVLPGRPHIIISRDAKRKQNSEKVFWVSSIDEALAQAELLIKTEDREAEIMVIGGANLFTQLESQASCLHITHIHASPGGDVFWQFNKKSWQLEREFETISSEKDSADYTVKSYKRA